MKYITRNEKESVNGKSKVYFTCHPNDRKLYFKEITESILKHVDCVIFYDENPDMPEDSEDFFFNLSEMRFIVIPITSNFIDEECFARKIFDFAMEKHIAVLPILEEENIDMNKVNKVCRNLQLLNPHEKDMTAISYDEKLKKYLDSIIVGDELEKKIKEEFASYIFLSYRKKDRRAAQKLMHLIHDNDFCRDVAIWYDEFLTPGENFNDEIESALKKSDLFTLTVTPNIVNEENYIMSTEYPMALDNNKEILPVEMKKTDSEKLNENYNSLPDVVSAENINKLNNSLKRLNPSEELNNDPEHIYLIGLAYKNGIDMEVNKQKGIELIEKSAKVGFKEAMSTMVEICISGDGIESDYNKAVEWQGKIVEIQTKIFNKTHSKDDELILADEINNLGELYSEYYTDVYDSDKALEMYEKALEIRKKVLGTEHIDTAQSYDNIGKVYSNIGEYEKAIEMHDKALEIKKKVLGTENIDIAETYYDIGKLYSKINKYEKAIEMYEKAVNVREKVLDNSAGYFCNKIFYEYKDICYKFLNINEYKKTLETYRKAINTGKRIDKFPEEQRFYAIYIISNCSELIIDIYNEIGKRYLHANEYDKAIKMYRKVLRNINKSIKERCCKLSRMYNNISKKFLYAGEYDRELRNYKECLEHINRKIEKDWYKVSVFYNNMGDVYFKMCDLEMNKKAMEMYKKALTIRKEKRNILYSVGAAITYNKIGYIYEIYWTCYCLDDVNIDKADEMYEKAALIKKEILSHVRSNVEESLDEIWDKLCNYSENFEYIDKDEFDIYRKYFESEYLKKIYPNVEECKLHTQDFYESCMEDKYIQESFEFNEDTGDYFSIDINSDFNHITILSDDLPF